MSSYYTDLCNKTNEIKGKLNACAKTLEAIKFEEKSNYEHPEYRKWSGDVKDLEEFIGRLEEWLSQPRVAEAKRYLSDLKNWSELQEEITLEEVEKNWRFLSNSVEKIKDIHNRLGNIGDRNIKKSASKFALERISEKDIETAENWATNANKFANTLKQFKDRKVESELAEEVKREAVGELLAITSFDKNNQDQISRYQELIDKAENIVKNKPQEIGERTLTKTYIVDKDTAKIEEKLSKISGEIEKTKDHLINSEWMEEFPNFKNYSIIWKEKQEAIKRDDLERITRSLRDVIQKASNWKESKQKEINNSLLRAERMVKGLEKEDLKNEFESLRDGERTIDWKKPNLESLHEIISKIDNLTKRLREELMKKLQNNKDATSIIEEPEIIEDLGRSKGWDFDRFFKALEVVLLGGLIEIQMVEEK